MLKNKITKEITWGGRQLSLETGYLAPQASGAVVARYGDTVVLATAVLGEEKKELGYFPLRVDFEEKLYAGGRIKGSRFVKREGRPSDEAVLTGRLIDRSIRPLFPKKDFYREVQIIVTMLSVDQENDPAILGMVATYAALAISPIPWAGPLAAARIGHRDGHFLLNPGNGELKYSDLDLVLASSHEGIVMVEAGANEVPEQKVLAALEWGHAQLQPVIEMIDELANETGRAKATVLPDEASQEIQQAATAFIQERLAEELLTARSETQDTAREELLEELATVFEGKAAKAELTEILDAVIRQAVRQRILTEGKRPDGRTDPGQIRPLNMQVGILPRTHGSAVFERGETQVLTIATLGSTSLEQLIEGPTGEETKRYIHHYNFPPFSTGETGRLGWPGRREVGHGALAERALLPMVPSEEDFPYTIRLVSEVLSSAGSTSMAATCGSTLALMDAGVPIKKPVAGIAMGLITPEGDGSNQFEILSDIQALEDFYGDMDLKVAGTSEGITVLQMDIKVKKVSHEILEKALSQAQEGRLAILEKMLATLGKPREQLSEYAPRIRVVQIDPKKIGEIIGPGGKTVRALQEETKTIIDIQEDGHVFISGINEDLLKKAAEQIEAMTKEIKAGEIYEGQVTRVLDFGAFVRILPGQEGLVHISELAHDYVTDVKSVVQEGDKVKVKVIEIDSQGRINLSIKALQEPHPDHTRQRTPHRSYPGRPSGRGARRSSPSYRTPYHQRPSYKRTRG